MFVALSKRSYRFFCFLLETPRKTVVLLVGMESGNLKVRVLQLRHGGTQQIVACEMVGKLVFFILNGELIRLKKVWNQLSIPWIRYGILSVLVTLLDKTARIVSDFSPATSTSGICRSKWRPFFLFCRSVLHHRVVVAPEHRRRVPCDDIVWMWRADGLQEARCLFQMKSATKLAAQFKNCGQTCIKRKAKTWIWVNICNTDKKPWSIWRN